MSAQELRDAAALMRARAEAATPGPWTFEGAPNGFPPMVTSNGMVVADTYDKPALADAEHISSWHPAVALAVAQMLEGVADRHEWMTVQSVDYSYTACRQCHHEPSEGFEDDDDPCPDVVAALAVSRAYLGSAS